MRKPKPDRGEHWVAYLDIMGYKSLVAQAIARRRVPSTVAALQETLDPLPHLLRGGNALGTMPPPRVSLFSDSVCLSAPDSSTGSAALSLLLALYLAEMARHGIFLRGAVALGQHYHGERVLFSPALVEAHILEQQAAFYPRVILPPIAVGNSTPPVKHSERFTRDCIWRDRDGHLFVNYLSCFHQLEERLPGEGLALLEAHRTNVGALLAEHAHDVRVAAKYHWTANYHNQFCRHWLGEDAARFSISMVPEQSPADDSPEVVKSSARRTARAKVLRPNRRKAVPTAVPKPKYRNSYVACLEMLGYEDMVRHFDASGPWSNSIELLEETVCAVSDVADRLRRESRARKDFSIRVFGRSICVSTWGGFIGGFGLLEPLAQMLLMLALGGVFTRGAISYGGHFDDGQVLFGPALVEGFDSLRLAPAPYPRVVVVNSLSSSHVMADFDAKCAAGEAGDHGDLLWMDADGRPFVSYLSILRVMERQMGRSMVLNVLRGHQRMLESAWRGRTVTVLGWGRMVLDCELPQPLLQGIPT